MLKLVVLSIATLSVFSAEIPSHSTPEHQSTFKPDVGEVMETHAVHKKQERPEQVHHPVYRGEEYRNGGRARMEPVRPIGDIVKHDMLADEPAPIAATDVSRIDNTYGYSAPVEVAYPDIPYAPGYGYGTGYSAPNSYDLYGPSDYLLEPDTSAFGLLWSQVPDARTLVSYAGRTISWVFSSVFVLMIGSFLTVGLCTYTNLCQITFNGVGPIHEEMRALITPERISSAADFVKTAIDKYQKVQKLPQPGTRKRRAVFY